MIRILIILLFTSKVYFAQDNHSLKKMLASKLDLIEHLQTILKEEVNSATIECTVKNNKGNGLYLIDYIEQKKDISLKKLYYVNSSKGERYFKTNRFGRLGKLKKRKVKAMLKNDLNSESKLKQLSKELTITKTRDNINL